MQCDNIFQKCYQIHLLSQHTELAERFFHEESVIRAQQYCSHVLIQATQKKSGQLIFSGINTMFYRTRPGSDEAPENAFGIKEKIEKILSAIFLQKVKLAAQFLISKIFYQKKI